MAALVDLIHMAMSLTVAVRCHPHTELNVRLITRFLWTRLWQWH